jgi:hypothetical protein
MRYLGPTYQPLRVGSIWSDIANWAKGVAQREIARPIQEEAQKAGQEEARKATAKVLAVGGAVAGGLLLGALLMRGRK